MSDQQLQAHPSPQPQLLARPAAPGLHAAAPRSALGWLEDAAMAPFRSLGGFGIHGPLQTGANLAHSSDPHAVQAGQLAAATRAKSGPAGNLSPALEAAARGESVAEQAQRVSGPVPMTAATALQVAGQLDPRQAWRSANQDPNAAYQSPFVSIGLSGITNDLPDAERLSRITNGSNHSHGYAVYGNDNDNGRYKSEINNPNQPGLQPSNPKAGTVDALNDVAAVTQYAAAAQLGITIKPNNKGDGKQVQIDWGALSQIPIQADMGLLGGKIKYDSPAQVAQNGYEAVLADMAKNGKKPDDKGQFISLTGHSGGGQSSFYTALKLASEGYKNVSLVGVDMAMTPHEREVLETLGVKVTNITSNSNLPAGLGQINSPVGDGIRAGMGGGQNYYDLNVHRQTDTLSPTGLHSATNDPNVVATMRFAQYLDSIGQHGNYSPQAYQQFLADTGGKGDKVHMEADGSGTPARDTQADTDLFAAGSTKVTDQRALPGPGANSTALGGGASPIETVVNLLGGKPVTQAIQGVGQAIHNGFDWAGGVAKSAAGLIPKAGGWLGGLVHGGMNLLGSGVNAAGNLVSGGLDKLGGFAQSTMSTVAGVTNFLGSAANTGLHAVGSGLSTAGTAIGNGLGAAGDTAKSWLGHVPLLGGFLGNVADKGLHLLGSGVSAAGNLAGAGVDKVGDLAQATTGVIANGENALGGLMHGGMNLLGSGARWLGGAVSGGLDRLGGFAQSAITGLSSVTGNVLGNVASTGLGAIGSGAEMGFNLLGDGAGMLVRSQTAPLALTLQAMGVDTSQIAGLSDFQGTNRSQSWNKYLGTDPKQIQTLDGVPPAPPAGDPVHAHYAN